MKIVFLGVVCFFWVYIWILWPKVHMYGNIGENILYLTRIIAIFWLKYGLRLGFRPIQTPGKKKNTGHNFRKIDRKSCFFTCNTFFESIYEFYGRKYIPMWIFGEKLPCLTYITEVCDHFLTKIWVSILPLTSLHQSHHHQFLTFTAQFQGVTKIFKNQKHQV